MNDRTRETNQLRSRVRHYTWSLQLREDSSTFKGPFTKIIGLNGKKNILTTLARWRVEESVRLWWALSCLRRRIRNYHFHMLLDSGCCIILEARAGCLMQAPICVGTRLLAGISFRLLRLWPRDCEDRLMIARHPGTCRANLDSAVITHHPGLSATIALSSHSLFLLPNLNNVVSRIFSVRDSDDCGAPL